MARPSPPYGNDGRPRRWGPGFLSEGALLSANSAYVSIRRGHHPHVHLVIRNCVFRAEGISSAACQAWDDGDVERMEIVQCTPRLQQNRLRMVAAPRRRKGLSNILDMTAVERQVGTCLGVKNITRNTSPRTLGTR